MVIYLFALVFEFACVVWLLVTLKTHTARRRRLEQSVDTLQRNYDWAFKERNELHNKNHELRSRLDMRSDAEERLHNIEQTLEAARRKFRDVVLPEVELGTMDVVVNGRHYRIIKCDGVGENALPVREVAPSPLRQPSELVEMGYGFVRDRLYDSWMEGGAAVGSVLAAPGRFRWLLKAEDGHDVAMDLSFQEVINAIRAAQMEAQHGAETGTKEK